MLLEIGVVEKGKEKLQRNTQTILTPAAYPYNIKEPVLGDYVELPKPFYLHKPSRSGTRNSSSVLSVLNKKHVCIEIFVYYLV